jgi:hypothetical protein
MPWSRITIPDRTSCTSKTASQRRGHSVDEREQLAVVRHAVGRDHRRPFRGHPWSPIDWRNYAAWGGAPRSVAYGFRAGRTTDRQ